METVSNDQGRGHAAARLMRQLAAAGRKVDNNLTLMLVLVTVLGAAVFVLLGVILGLLLAGGR